VPQTDPIAIRDLRHLDELLSGTSTEPLLIFKHSRSCGTSSEALDELRAYLAAQGTPIACAMVTVQEQRDLSDAIAERLAIRHETPQALLVAGGRVRWSASHFRVTAAELARAIDHHGFTSALNR